MEIWFIQGFTEELKVFYSIGKNKVEQHLFEGSLDINKIIESVKDIVKDENLIKKVNFKGNTHTLKELENYYKGIKGVKINGNKKNTNGRKI